MCTLNALEIGMCNFLNQIGVISLFGIFKECSNDTC